MYKPLIRFRPWLAAWLCCAITQAAQAQYDPNFHYFINGQVIGERAFSVGDASNWNRALEGLSGRSATGKVKVESATLNAEGDAIRVTWSRKETNGQIALYGKPVGLSFAKDKAALVFAVKVEKPPRGQVTIAMDCDWPCRGSINAEDMLKDAPVGEWFSFPIPLSCFRGEEFDLSKINGVFLMSTESRMTVSIANIRVERLPDDMQGCSE